MVFFLEDGTKVDRHGRPLLKKPQGVPKGALPNGSGWVSGVWDEDSQKVGEHRFYDHQGNLHCVENYKAGKANGINENFRSDGTLWSTFHYEEGKLTGPFFIHHGTGEVARKGELLDGKWAGPLEDFDEQGTSLSTYDFPPPDSKKVNSLSKEEVKGMQSEGFEFSKPSPVLLGAAISIGWGGTEDRDQVIARRVRSALKIFAKTNPAMEGFLEDSGLAYAPRLITFERVLLLQNLAEKYNICTKAELSGAT